MLIRIDVTGYRLDELPVRGQRSVLKKTMGKMLRRWSQRYLNKHFEVGSGRRYAYKPRKLATLDRKRRLAERGAVEDGGLVDLVWTGQTRRLVLRSRYNIREYPTRATVKLEGPSWFRIRYKPGRPNLADEVTRVIPSERRDLAQYADKLLESEISKWINRYGTKKLSKVRKK